MYLGMYGFTYESSVLHNLMKGTLERASAILNHPFIWAHIEDNRSVNLMVDPNVHDAP